MKTKSIQKNVGLIFAGSFFFCMANGQAPVHVTALSGAASNGDGAGNSGTYNTSVGGFAGANLSSGSNNTFLGFEAGVNITLQTDNTYLGWSAGKYSGYVDSEQKSAFNIHLDAARYGC